MTPAEVAALAREFAKFLRRANKGAVGIPGLTGAFDAIAIEADREAGERLCERCGHGRYFHGDGTTEGMCRNCGCRGFAPPPAPTAGREAAPAGDSGRRLPCGAAWGLATCTRRDGHEGDHVCGVYRWPVDASEKGSTPDSRRRDDTPEPYMRPAPAAVYACDCGEPNGHAKTCSVWSRRTTPAPFDPEAKAVEVLLPCARWDACVEIRNIHSEGCPARFRSAVARAIADADRAGYERGIEAAAAEAEGESLPYEYAVAQRIRALREGGSRR